MLAAHLQVLYCQLFQKYPDLIWLTLSELHADCFGNATKHKNQGILHYNFHTRMCFLFKKWHFSLLRGLSSLPGTLLRSWNNWC